MELRAEEPGGAEQVKDTGRRCSGNKALPVARPQSGRKRPVC